MLLLIPFSPSFDDALNSDLWVNSISSSSYWDLIYPVVTVHSSASATITVSGKSFTSDSTGNTQHSMPWGTFSVSDSVSGQSFECTIGRDTTDVYVMPDGFVLYWYGNKSFSWVNTPFQSQNAIFDYANDTDTTVNKTEKTNCLSISAASKGTFMNTYSSFYVEDTIDFSKYTKLRCHVYNTYSGEQSISSEFATMSIKPSGANADVRINRLSTNLNTNDIQEIDISSITSELYLMWCLSCAGSRTKINNDLYAVWLE